MMTFTEEELDAVLFDEFREWQERFAAMLREFAAAPAGDRGKIAAAFTSGVQRELLENIKRRLAATVVEKMAALDAKVKVLSETLLGTGGAAGGQGGWHGQ